MLALRILRELAEADGPTGVTTLAANLGTTKSRISRYLQTLVQEGFVQRAPDSERYQVGPGMVKLSLNLLSQINLLSAARPVLANLRDALGHSAVTSQFEGDGIRVIAALRGKSDIEIGVLPGSPLSLHGSAQGKLALAFGPANLREKVLSSELVALTPQTITNPEALDVELDRIRNNGWAMAANEALIGLNTLAAPIFEGNGRFVGTIAINDSVQHIGNEPTAQQLSEILRAAAAISEDLGFSQEDKA